MSHAGNASNRRNGTGSRCTLTSAPGEDGRGDGTALLERSGAPSGNSGSDGGAPIEEDHVKKTYVRVLAILSSLAAVVLAGGAGISVR